MNLLVGLGGLHMIPHPSLCASGPVGGKELRVTWNDVKYLTHTKHHVIVTVLAASVAKKLRFCVGTTR